MKHLFLLTLILLPLSAAAQDKPILQYRSYYTNAEAKEMCEKCDAKVNKGQVNESCSMCVGYFRGILSSVDEMNALRQKVDERTVQICYRTDTVGKIIYNYVNHLSRNSVKIDGNSYNSFVEFLARDYPCETTVINDDSKRDAFFDNIQQRMEGR
jgi:hypothetical protein